MIRSKGNVKRQRSTYQEIRQKIIDEFSRGERTVNQIAKSTGLTWRTVDLHLIWLTGKGAIEPVFLSEYVKIYRKKEHAESRLVKRGGT
ncbi:ArsR family transcriptional regulator [Candidatus Woesearchaeota archaeon]|nr:ArsR family transcriptional regulator [Candidatus Woesearchaeota archaeon]